MGNIFSYFFKNTNEIEVDESLLEPLNSQEQNASLLEINTLNSQVNILEKTTQNSLINISKDVKHLFQEIENIKYKITIIENANNNSIYHDFNDNFNHNINYEEENNSEENNSEETY